MFGIQLLLLTPILLYSSLPNVSANNVQIRAVYLYCFNILESLNTISDQGKKIYFKQPYLTCYEFCLQNLIYSTGS